MIPRFNPTHHAGSAFMLFLLGFYLLINILMSFILPLAVDYFGVDIHVIISPWFIIFTQLIGLLLPLGIWLALTRDNLNKHLPNMKLGKTNLIYIIFISLFLQPGMMVISGLSSLFFPNQVAEVLSIMVDNPLWTMILAIAVTPAICEELVFRGYIQSKYKNMSFKKAAIINGLFFAIIHMSPQQFIYAFIMGIIFAYMVHYTRSIRAGILSHFIMNASQVTLAVGSLRLLQYVEASELYTTTMEETIVNLGTRELVVTYEMSIIFSVMFVGIIAMFAIPCAIILFRSFISYNRGRNMKYDMEQALGVNSNTPKAPSDDDSTTPIIDPFMIAVVVLYIAFTILTAL